MKKKYLVLALLLVTSCVRAPKGIVRQTDGSLADVQAKCDAANDGDTVTIPNGTFDWGPTLKIAKCITLKGNAQPDSATGKVDLSHTIVRDTSVTGPIIAIKPIPGQPARPVDFANSSDKRFVRVTGIAFEKHPDVKPDNHPGIDVKTTIPFRYDHCSERGLYHGGNFVDLLEYNYGVIDHCVHQTVIGVTFGEGLVWARFGHATPDKGDYAFSQPIHFGGYDWFFVEDNWVWHCSDITAGGKLSWRHNVIAADECCRMKGHCSSAGSHVSHGIGNNGSSGWRGGRGYELVNNVYRYDDNTSGGASMDGITSGSLLIAHNKMSNRSASGTVQHQVIGMGLNDYRYYNNEATNGGFDGASGFSKWDINCTAKSGWTCTAEGEGPGVVFYSGTTAAGTTQTHVEVTDSNPGFPTPDGLKGYSIYRVSDGMTFLITGNTSNALTIFGSMHGGSPPVWVAGQSFRIGKVVHAFDSPSWGKGDMISRDSSGDAIAAWDHSVIETAYSWDNQDLDRPGQQIVLSGRCKGITPGCSNIVEGSELPGYTPYTYPHPLVTYIDGGATPAPSESPTIPTSTPQPSPTAAATPTNTPQPTVAPTATVAPSATATSTTAPTATAAPTATKTPTSTPIPVTPAAPSNLTFQVVKGKDVQLSWVNNATNAVGIEVQRNVQTENVWNVVVTLPPSDSTWTDTSTSKKKTYLYRVRAKGTDSYSEWTAILEVTP